MSQQSILSEIAEERARQDAKWGQQNWPDGTGLDRHLNMTHVHIARAKCDYARRDGTITYRHILKEEILEAFAEADPVALRKELLQSAAVIVQWMERIDRDAHAKIARPPFTLIPVMLPQLESLEALGWGTEGYADPAKTYLFSDDGTEGGDA